MAILRRSATSWEDAQEDTAPPTDAPNPESKGAPPRPIALAPVFDTIAPEMKQVAQWVCWKYGPWDGTRFPKVPYQPNDRYASVSNPLTWRSFDVVREASQHFDGVGYATKREDRLAFIDLDHCLTPSTGAITPEAMEVVKRINSRTEPSVGGDGLRIIVDMEPDRKPHECIPAGTIWNGVDIEVYYEKHYLTITGRAIAGYETITSRTDAMLALHQEIKAAQQRTDAETKQSAKQAQADPWAGTEIVLDPLSNDEIIERAGAVPTPSDSAGVTLGDMFQARMAGSCAYDMVEDKKTGRLREDASRRDLHLLVTLLWWTQGDEGQALDIFALSGCWREKSERDDYLRRTFDRAKRDCKTVRGMRKEEHDTDSSGGSDTTDNQARQKKRRTQDKASEQQQAKDESAPTIHSFSDLLYKKFDPIKWIVPDMLTDGLYLLAGKSKMGKSWLLFGLGLAVASGGVALGTKRVERGDVLYLALEDSERRLQDRLHTILPPGLAIPVNFEYATTWPKMGADGLAALEGWIDTHPQARLIIVDTWAKVKPESRKKNAYDADYDVITPLWHLANTRHVCILLTLHLRKASASDPLDEINATTGIAGAADGTLILKRERGRADAAMFGTGREISEFDAALSFNGGIWSLLGNAEEYRMSQERKAIMTLLREIAPAGMKPKEMAAAMGKNYNTLKVLLRKMEADEEVRSVDGTYYLPKEEKK